MLDDLREGIGLRGYAQKEPVVEYQKEAYDMFESLLNPIDSGNSQEDLPDPAGRN